MSRLLGLSLLTVLVLLLAGCADATPASAALTTTATNRASATPEATVTVETHCLKGTVVDEELKPVSSASLSLLPLNLNVTTGEDGIFEFCGLEAGRYQLAAARLGYEAWARALDIPLEGGELRVVLVAIAILDPYVLVVPKTVHYTFGISTLDTTTSRNGVNPNTCSPCTWTLLADRLPDFLLWETTWQRNPSPPSPAADTMYHILRGGIPFESGTDIGTGTKGKPWSVNYTGEKIGANANVKAAKEGVPLSGSVYCTGDPVWPCMDQRIHVWLTLFYDYEEIPAGYTSLPPA